LLVNGTWHSLGSVKSFSGKVITNLVWFPAS
jgi:hypothetical protein